MAYDTTQSLDVTQIAKFKLDLISGSEKTPTGGWWSITGGDANIEFADITSGEDTFAMSKPGQAYFGDISVRGPFCKDRKTVMTWVNDTAKGKRDRKDLTLEFLNDKEEAVMTFTLSQCIPTSYSPPAVAAGNYDLLEETLSFLVIKVDQA